MKHNKLILVATFMLSVVASTAQSLNSAYFTDDYKFRHTMNPAFGNDQGYVSIPGLGNLTYEHRVTSVMMLSSCTIRWLALTARRA